MRCFSGAFVLNGCPSCGRFTSIMIPKERGERGGRAVAAHLVLDAPDGGVVQLPSLEVALGEAWGASGSGE